MKRFNINIVYLCLAAFLFSCKANQNIPYFKNIPQSSYGKIDQIAYTEPKIISDDILDISIQTAEPDATNAIRAGAVSANVYSPNVAQRTTGYQVDKNGNIELPVLGSVKVKGLTTFEAREVIREAAKKYYNGPTVQVRFVNFRITLIGEVSRPSSYTVPNERINIIDAIALAGDLTLYGRRENVLLIRETPTGKEMVRFNLNDAEIFKSPYYYLRQNDIIYVEPNQSRIARTESGRFSSWATIASLISTLTLIFFRFN